MKIATLKIAFFLLAISFTNCSKDEASLPSLQQLPPMTQVGANTVGCLVNGEVLLPKGSNPVRNPITTCFYQFVNNQWNFSLGFSNNEKENLRGINLASKNIILKEGITYNLVLDNNNSAFATYFNFGTPDFITTSEVKGKLTIDKLDTGKSIISGTFWFNAINANGEKIEIRNGRFDMQYSQ
ncbi:conserved exported protein of unknown function [Tenacibaculum sp. 190524A02b]|uniref:DUF6252 family protein n=1 Tax=Tenacibaculum vairaonense TaxID=3137860 RepID=UPI0032B1B2A6